MSPIEDVVLEAAPAAPDGGPEPLVRDVPAGEPYPVGALGPLRAAVEAVAGVTQAPVAIAAQSALSAASLALQGHANVETLAGDAPLSLYCMTIARSGERKSTCDRHMLDAVRDFEIDKSSERRDEIRSWRIKHTIWKAEHDRIIKSATGKKADATALRAGLEELGPEPDAPPLPERIVTEPTFEGLTRLFLEGQPSLGIFSDEGGQFLGGHGMNSDNRQKMLAALNDLWHGNPIRRTRAGDGAYTLHGRRLAIGLMAQPEVAYPLLADPLASGSGFLARFLIAEPPSNIGYRLSSKAQSDTTEAIPAFKRRLREILDTPMPMEMETRELSPPLLRLSPPAQVLLLEYSDGVEREQAAGGRLHDHTAVASKAAEHATRLAGVLTLWENPSADYVPEAAMEWGIRLACYYVSEAVRLADASSLDKCINQAEALRKWLLEKWTEEVVLPSDVIQRAPIRALRTAPAARAAIAMLVKYGWLIPLPRETEVRGKVRREAYRIVRPRHDRRTHDPYRGEQSRVTGHPQQD